MSNLVKILVPCLAIGLIYLIANYQPNTNNSSDTCRIEKTKATMDYFRAAVYEHSPLGDNEKHSPRQILDWNLDEFIKAIRLASKENVQLLVFPEDSLINSEDYNRTMLMGEILEIMPNPSKTGPVNLCETTPEEYDGHRNGKHRSILRTISCLAKQYRMFIALAFGDRVLCDPKQDSQCPDDGNYLYNTIGLFDWDGSFVAKYHKMHLYNESQYDIPQESVAHGDPVQYYDTPFGRIGLMLCFDLLYRLPGIELVEKHRVDTIIYPTYWFNYVPFLTSVQIQQAFAFTHRVNFVSACVQIPDSASIGSGIYSGENGAIIYSNRADGKSKLLIATIPSDPKRPQNNHKKSKCSYDTKSVVVREEKPDQIEDILHYNVSQIKMIQLNSALSQDYINWCCPYSGVCCRLFYRVRNVEQFSKETFVLLAGNATAAALNMKKYRIREEYCALAKCDDEKCDKFSTNSGTDFEFVNLGATFRGEYAYPSVVVPDLQLLPVNQWKFSKVGSQQYSIVVRNPKQKLLNVAIYGRDYANDPEYKQQKYV